VSNVYLSPTCAPLLVLGFASGLPLALTKWYLAGLGNRGRCVSNSDWLSDFGGFGLHVEVFVGRPLLDRYAVPFLGRRRGWIALSQLAISSFYCGDGLFDPGAQLGLIALLGCFCGLYVRDPRHCV